MNKRLCIGLLSPSEALIQILDSIGCSVEHVKPGRGLINNYSVIITESSAHGFHESLSDYVRGGGAWLELGQDSVGLNKRFRSTSYINFLINEDRKPGTEGLPFLDLYASATVKDGSGQLSSIYSIQSSGKGLHAWAGLNLDHLWKNPAYKRKRFLGYAGTDPDEIVSATDRSGVIQFIRYILKQLHFQRGLPWISKWDSPSKSPVFCFRIDSDYGTPEGIRSLFEVCTEFKIRPTWFLHVKVHEEWLHKFHEFEAEGHEIALHGYEHFTSDESEKICHNIQKGYQKLSGAGFAIRGFCAPYGIWNHALKKVLSASTFEFEYSSEFTRLYNGIPTWIEDTPLQIPIHPICTGSLVRKGYSVDHMSDYFMRSLERNTGLGEPSIFYHHPMQPGLEAIRQLLLSVHKHSLTNLTFNEYARFWKQRSESNFQAFFNGDKIMIDDTDGELWYQVCTDFSQYELLKKNQISIRSDLATFKYAPPSLPSPERIRKLKRKSPGLLKTSILDWVNRQKR